jgi:hypothetical protein
LDWGQRTNSFIFTEQHNNADKRRHTSMPRVGLYRVLRKEWYKLNEWNSKSLNWKSLNDLYAGIFKHTNIKKHGSRVISNGKVFYRVS